jgi:hypothetical protein
MRLIEYPAAVISTNNQLPIYGPSVNKIFPRYGTYQPAFDSQNRLVVGQNAYWNVDPKRFFPTVFYNPLSSSTTPDTYLNDYHSFIKGIAFDSLDNLYIADEGRNRVLIYKNPFNSQITPTVIPSPTLVPTSSPSLTPTPTHVVPTPTLTPSIAPTFTPTPTISSDMTPPTVTITSPLNGAIILRSKRVTISASAFDNVRVTRVEFRINNSLKCSDTSAPYSCMWNVPGSRGATYLLKATAYDDANNSSSYQISVTSSR